MYSLVRSDHPSATPCVVFRIVLFYCFIHQLNLLIAIKLNPNSSPYKYNLISASLPLYKLKSHSQNSLKLPKIRSYNQNFGQIQQASLKRTSCSN
uniref:Uncharacterized protein n=1 Tax=Helianthus annuus TaxID=4232 RepID=A0A251RVI3_HELAN